MEARETGLFLIWIKLNSSITDQENHQFSEVKSILIG